MSATEPYSGRDINKWMVDRRATGILSPRTACLVAVVLAVVMTLTVLYGASHHRADTGIANCTMVSTREHGTRCLP